MKKYIFFICTILVTYSPAAMPSKLSNAQFENERRQVNSAERIIIIELTRALSASIRKQMEACFSACVGSGAMELGIGLIGVSYGASGTAALVNLLGVRLDGGGSEERTCQMLNRGNNLSEHLINMDASKVVENCHSVFFELKKLELRDVHDVNVDRVCKTESAATLARDEILQAIKSKNFCE